MLTVIPWWSWDCFQADRAAFGRWCVKNELACTALAMAVPGPRGGQAGRAPGGKPIAWEPSARGLARYQNQLLRDGRASVIKSLRAEVRQAERHFRILMTQAKAGRLGADTVRDLVKHLHEVLTIVQVLGRK